MRHGRAEGTARPTLFVTAPQGLRPGDRGIAPEDDPATLVEFEDQPPGTVVFGAAVVCRRRARA